MCGWLSPAQVNPYRIPPYFRSKLSPEILPVKRICPGERLRPESSPQRIPHVVEFLPDDSLLKDPSPESNFVVTYYLIKLNMKNLFSETRASEAKLNENPERLDSEAHKLIYPEA